MKSVKLSVVCDQAQSENVCVQLSDRWARISVTYPALFSTSASIKHLLARAARMITAVVGSIDLDTADISVTLTGYDVCSSEELREQVAEEWIRALIEVMRSSPCAAAASPSAKPEAPKASNAPTGSVSCIAGGLDVSAGGALAKVPVATSDAAMTPPKVPGVTNITPLSRDERRAKVIQNMVQTVRQYVQTFGSAPDFSSERAQVVNRVHNYIRSVTTRQQAPTDVLEAVRIELATKQNEK